MKTTPLLSLLVALLLTGCSTAYRTGQTPDDVYFSPPRAEEEYVRVQRQETRRYRYAEEDYEDRFLRMRINDRNRWNDLNDWYTFERWSLGYNNFYSPTLNPYVSWNYYYNPYFLYAGAPVSTIKNVYTRPRLFNLNSYQPVANGSSVAPTRNNNSKFTLYGNGGNGSNKGSALREAFNGGNGGSYSSPSVGGSTPAPTGNSGGAAPAPVRKF